MDVFRGLILPRQGAWHVIFSLVVGFLLIKPVTAGGRAFPVDAVKNTLKFFQSLNPELEWDHSRHFVTDFSGQFALCKYNKTSGIVPTDTITPSGKKMTAVVDHASGILSNSYAVTQTIAMVMEDWEFTEPFKSQILVSKQFGCSVRPRCGTQTVVACLFSDEPVVVIKPTLPPVVTTTPYPAVTTTQYQEQVRPPTEIVFPPQGSIKARAFTPEQYIIAEGILGKDWDRIHFLENLSGMEAKCAMVNQRFGWSFAMAERIGEKYRWPIEAQYGSSPNLGNTQEPMEKILRQWRRVPRSSQMGCCVIPDCVVRNQMQVVVVCLFGNKRSK